MRARPHAFALVASMGWRAFMHEKISSICLVLTLISVLGPLLVLFGLKYGLVDTLAHRLIEDVRNREVRLIGSGKFDDAWFAMMRERADVAFIVASTRSISASFNLVRGPERRKSITGLQMLATGPHDPLLDGAPELDNDFQVILSALAARKLGVSAGGKLRARIQRIRGGAREGVWVDLDVVHVGGAGGFAGVAAFVSRDLLVATEDYRDGFSVAKFGWSGNPPRFDSRTFARFRLYARSIYDVSALRDFLTAQRLEVRTAAAQVEAMQAMERRLNWVFAIIAGIGGVGFIASLAASLTANVDRHRQSLSLLHLMGFPKNSILAFPTTQSFIVALSGGAAALMLFFVVAFVLNQLFANDLQTGEYICRLEPSHILMATGLTGIIALLSSIWAGGVTLNIEPTEGLRDG